MNILLKQIPTLRSHWNFSLGIFFLSMGSATIIAKPLMPPSSGFIHLGVGTTTFNSELVKSNNLGTSVNLKFGLYTGLKNSFGMILDNEITETKFDYASVDNKSKIETFFSTVSILYRWLYFQLGLVMDKSTYDVTKLDSYYLSAYGMGYGGLFSAYYPFGSIGGSPNFAKFQISYVGKSQDKEIIDGNAQEVSLGPRSRIEFIYRFNFGANFFMELAYKIRNFNLDIDTKQHEERQTSTWITFGSTKGER